MAIGDDAVKNVSIITDEMYADIFDSFLEFDHTAESNDQDEKAAQLFSFLRDKLIGEAGLSARDARLHSGLLLSFTKYTPSEQALKELESILIS